MGKRRILVLVAGVTAFGGCGCALVGDPVGDPLVVPASTATCSAVGLLALDALGADLPGATAPSVTEITAVDASGALVLARRDVVERDGERLVRERTTSFVEGCPVLEVETWFAPWASEQGVPVHREQRVFDPDRAWMLSPYAPTPLDEVTVWTLDAAGHPVLRETDIEADGTVDVVETMAYDAAGRLVHALSSVAEGVAPESETVRERTLGYDAAGNLVFEETRSVWWENEHVSAIERSYDVHRQLIWERHSAGGAVYSEEHRAWAGLDKPLSRELRRSTAVSRADWTWRPNGSVVISSTESESGRVWRAETNELDPQGRLVRYEQDQPYDGFVDWVDVRTWRDDGQPLTELARARSPGGPDTVMRDATWTYDASGRPVEHLLRTGYQPTRSVWAYEGLDERLSAYEIASGRLLRELLTVRDAAGRTILEAWDMDGDGQDNWTSEWRYDADGRLYATLVDHDGDGELDNVVLSAFAPVVWEGE